MSIVSFENSYIKMMNTTFRPSFTEPARAGLQLQQCAEAGPPRPRHHQHLQAQGRQRQRGQVSQCQGDSIRRIFAYWANAECI